MNRIGVLIFLVLLATSATAQQSPTGFPPYGSFQHGQFDNVNLENLNFTFSIPIVSVPGRGISFQRTLTYNSTIWSIVDFGYGPGWTHFYAGAGPLWGFNRELGTGQLLYDLDTMACTESEFSYRHFNYRYVEQNGTVHPFGLEIFDEPTSCGWPTSGSGFAGDGSGYFLNVGFPPAGPVFAPSGVMLEYGTTDTNGNYLTETGLVWNTWMTNINSAGQAALKVYATNNYFQYQVQDTTGAYQTLQLTTQLFNIKTNFGCPGLGETNT